VRQNRLKYTLTIEEHLVVPEAKHFPALVFQIGVADNVATAFCVLRTVSLDDQLSANAKKVDDVRADGSLSAKLDSVQATITQKTPEAQLDVSRRASHCSSARALASGDAFVSLHSSPIDGEALIRRASGAPPSPRGRRGSGAAVSHIPSPSGRRWRVAPDEGWRMDRLTTS
jgi:hypothetical protein